MQLRKEECVFPPTFIIWLMCLLRLINNGLINHMQHNNMNDSMCWLRGGGSVACPSSALARVVKTKSFEIWDGAEPSEKLIHGEFSDNLHGWSQELLG